MLSAADDLRWCANIALGGAFVLLMGGVIFSAHLDDGREYALAMFTLAAFLFAAVGCGIHLWVWRCEKRITIHSREDF